MKPADDFNTLHPSSRVLNPFSSDLFQQRIDAFGLFFDGVPHEVKRGSMPQIEREAKLLAYIRRGVTQGAQSLIVLPLVALHSHVNAGVAQIIGNAHLGYCHHRQSRIFKFVTDDLRDLFAQGIGDALNAMHNQASGSSRQEAGNKDPAASLLPSASYSSVAATCSMM
jgi:hypothetical protein